MHIRSYGQDPSRAAVIHGGPGAPGTVAAIARVLSEHIGVLEPIQTKTTLEGQISELFETLKAYADKPITLIGHSWGAWLAYLTALRHPSIVKKLILVGCPPFEQKYVPSLRENRLKRLSNEDAKEFKLIIEELNSPSSTHNKNNYVRLSELVTESDSFDVLNNQQEDQDKVIVKSNEFIPVWKEAAELRKMGLLIEYADQLQCPVAAIHGDHDPHPFEGVKKPLENALDDFHFYLLEKCGHSPWKERFAKDSFYNILKQEII
ncbi:alpha/beta fold hydrolase [Chengkuizengella axinellae]|uniref:Alpha/beta hydrolase n=1 Tax=Chengkuizengella axinellae TaxID=3064388 RepID=A0ABT9IY29_9BACL|nr:alpha/beta hydrolase [Chengkuizengella sp. 2205SS18-9]MDP5274218.1 alpha/beta hydrolase [Chengkuizengella sp. 2205SS18-9]